MTRTLTKENISVTVHEGFGPGTVLTIRDLTDDQEIYLYDHEVETIYNLTKQIRNKPSNPPDDEL